MAGTRRHWTSVVTVAAVLLVVMAAVTVVVVVALAVAVVQAALVVVSGSGIDGGEVATTVAVAVNLGDVGSRHHTDV